MDSVIASKRNYEGWDYFPKETVDNDPNKVKIHLRRKQRYIDMEAGVGVTATVTYGIGYTSGSNTNSV